MKHLLVFVSLFFALGSPGVLAQNSPQNPAPTPVTVNPYGVLFTIDPAYTAPGTIEFESDPFYADRFLSAPMVLRFTPDTKNRFFRTTEFAVISGLVSGLNDSGRRNLLVSDSLTLYARHPFYERGRFTAGIAPHAAFFTRGENRGGVYGANILLNVTSGLNSVTANLNFSAATRPSPSNPSSREEVLASYWRTLGKGGIWSKLVAAVAVSYQVPAGSTKTISFGEGASVKIKPSLEIDFGVFQNNVNGQSNNGIALAFTKNLGRFR